MTDTRAVFFDIGGVLEHNPRTGWQRRWAQRLGVTEAELETRVADTWRAGSIGTVSLGEVERRIAACLKLSPQALRALMDDAWAEYVGTLNVELTEYFAGLRPRYRTGIISNSFVGARELEQAAYGFQDLCDTIVYSHEEGCMKPAPRIYLAACERLGVAPREAVFLDDVAENVAGARTVGMRGVRFRNNRQAIAELGL